MFPRTHHLIEKKRNGFALISVLALVSLAALTATAFLASARLERQATLPMGNTVRLEWALTSAEKCAEQTIGDAFEPTGPKNFVTTLWRGTNANDWINEVGYLLIGKPNATTSVKWTYYAGFSPSGMTNLSTKVIGSATTFTNSHQGTFLAECGTYFQQQGTNGFTNNPAYTSGTSNRSTTSHSLSTPSALLHTSRTLTLSALHKFIPPLAHFPHTPPTFTSTYHLFRHFTPITPSFTPSSFPA
jgi:hypothetical protein